MNITLRNFIVTSVPALAAIFGFLWFTRKKKQNVIEEKKPKDKPVVRPKENVTSIKKDEQVLSARDIVSEQLPLGTPTLLNTATLSDTQASSKSPKPPDDTMPSPQLETKPETKSPVNKDDVRSLTVHTPLATSTPITSHSTHQKPSESWNNNKNAKQATKPVPIVEEKIEATAQSAVTAKRPVEKEIGQGDRPRSSDVPFSTVPSQNGNDNVLASEALKKKQEVSSIAPSLSAESRSNDETETTETVNSENDQNGIQSSSVGSSDSEEEATVSDFVPSSERMKTESVERSVDREAHEESVADSEVSAMNNGMIAEPTMSGASSLSSPAETPTNGVNGSHSDAQSEHSADSGQGSSITSVQPTEDGAVAGEKVEYAFDFPAEMCGMLIGRRGAHIKELKDRSGAVISVRDKLYTSQFKLIVLEGSQKSIDIALDIVKKRFPPHKFGPIDFSPAPAENPAVGPEIMQLSIPDGMCVDVNVSSVVTPNHLFLQQPTHLSFQMLDKQNACMIMCYAQDGIVPQLPRPIEVGMICAAPMFHGWYRAQVVAVHEETDEVEVKYVDYGGYAKAQSCLLRQIRSDFTTLPFQAVECYLANVIPPKDMTAFPPESNAVLEEFVHNQILQAEVVAYEEDGVPYIQLYQTLPDRSIRLINRELVNRGVGRWAEQQL